MDTIRTALTSKVVAYEEEGKPVTEAINQFRKAWLGS